MKNLLVLMFMVVNQPHLVTLVNEMGMAIHKEATTIEKTKDEWVLYNDIGGDRIFLAAFPRSSWAIMLEPKQ